MDGGTDNGVNTMRQPVRKRLTLEQVTLSRTMSPDSIHITRLSLDTLLLAGSVLGDDLTLVCMCVHGRHILPTPLTAFDHIWSMVLSGPSLLGRSFPPILFVTFPQPKIRLVSLW